MVVLPTPPLPLATATRFFTPGIGWRSGCCMGAGPGCICFLFGGTGISCLSSVQSICNQSSPAASAKRRQTGMSVLLYSSAVALLVFLARPARARIVAAYFRANLHRFWRFGLRGPGLILQIFLLTLLAALDFTRHGGLNLRLVCARAGAGHTPRVHLMRRARAPRPL